MIQSIVGKRIRHEGARIVPRWVRQQKRGSFLEGNPGSQGRHRAWSLLYVRRIRQDHRLNGPMPLLVLDIAGDGVAFGAQVDDVRFPGLPALPGGFVAYSKDLSHPALGKHVVQFARLIFLLADQAEGRLQNARQTRGMQQQPALMGRANHRVFRFAR